MVRPEIRRYLSDLKCRLRLDPTAERDVIRELHTHLEEESDELCQAGFAREEAARIATERFGSTQNLAREIHLVYGKGTLFQAFLAAVPHLLIAIAFGFHLWQRWYWMLAILLSIVAVAIYQWRRGKPAWLYPWLGYCLVLLLILALVLWQFSSIPSPWLWLLLLAYISFALWLLASIMFRVVRHDWLLASLMILPLPVAIGWLLTLAREGLIHNEQGFHGISSQIALTFLILAVATVAFIRLRHRLFKIALLLATTLVILIAILPATGALLVLALLLTGSLLLPLLLEHKIGHEQWENESWEQLIFEKRPRG